MKRKALVAAATMLLGFGTVAQAAIIDLFDDPSLPGYQLAQVTSDTQQYNSYTSTATPAGTILGGVRTLYINGISDNSVTNPAGIGVENGQLTLSMGSASVASAEVIWDGTFKAGTAATAPAVGDITNGSAPSINYTGLNADVIQQPGCPSSGCTQFDVTVNNSDLGFPFTVAIYTDSTNYTVFSTESAAVAPGFPQTFDIPFTVFGLPDGTTGTGILGNDFQVNQFGTGADLTNVGAIVLALNATNPVAGATISVDLGIDAITKSGVPEPSVLALMGIGMAAGGFATRRRKSKKA